MEKKLKLNPKFYGKLVSEMNITEKQLLRIDTMLVNSFKLTSVGHKQLINGFELGTMGVSEFLSDMKIIIVKSLLNLTDDDDITEISENSRYSFRKFMIDFRELETKIMNEEEKEENDLLKDMCMN